MIGYWVASESRDRAAGSRIAGTLVGPAGTLHAVDPSTEEVVCGLPLDSLHPFPDVRWAQMRMQSKCRHCRVVAG